MTFQINNSKEFERIFRELYTPLCQKAYKIVKDKDLSEDLVQQVFVNLWEKREEIKINATVKAYLYKAIIYAAFNHIRKKSPFVEWENQLTEPFHQNEDLEYQETLQQITSII